jgi:hypothetical protein
MKWPASRGSSAVMGEPCEMKSGGMVFMALIESPVQGDAIQPACTVNSVLQRRPCHQSVTVAPMTALRPPTLRALAWRQTLRDFRAGELRLLAVAVMLAVAALTAVGFFADRLGGGLQRDARQLLGGDAVVGSDQPAPADLVAKAQALGLRVASNAGLSEHGPRARRQGRRHAPGGGEGRQRQLPAARQLQCAPRRAARCRRWPPRPRPARCGWTRPCWTRCSSRWATRCCWATAASRSPASSSSSPTAARLFELCAAGHAGRIRPARHRPGAAGQPRELPAGRGRARRHERCAADGAVRDFVAYAEAQIKAVPCAVCASSRCKAAAPRCARRWTAPRSS